MQPFLELLVGSLADRYDLAGEVEGLARQLVVEVHPDLVVCDFQHLAGDDPSVLGHHRDDVAHGQESFLDLAVDFEDSLGQLEDSLGVVNAIAVLWREGEVESIANGLACDVGLKFGKKIALSEDEVQGLLLGGLVALDLQLISQSYNFVFVDVHCIG